ncbi:hypothetical protein MHBO_002615 [Bonamia ostreae]|uniref:Amino acid transporter n=1 Tax=Bonamia ostreae TaxID=126728 RepID=A0ABV2AMW8_9EUKA
MCVCRSEDVFSRVQKFFVFPSKYVPPILGICFGIGFGFVFRNLGIPNDAITLIQLIGDLYFNGLKAVMLLYLFVSMVLNSIKIASEKNACSLMIITLLSFTTGTILTSLMGIGAMKVVEPYITKADTSNIQYKHAESDITKTLEQLFNKFLPSNYVAAMSQNNIPGTLVFGMCFGMFAAGVIKSRMQKDKKNYMQDILELTEKSLMRIVDFLILVTAVGVFSIIASQTLSLKNIDVLRKLLIFLIPYVICLLL